MAIVAGSDIVASDFISTSAGAGDSGKVPKLNSAGKIDTSFTVIQPTIQIFTSSGTWTKPAGCKKIVVEILGGGRGADSGTGGEAADYCKKVIDVSAISSVVVTIGNGGAGNTGFNSYTAAQNGQDSTFGSYVTSAGGGSSTTSTGDLIVTGALGLTPFNVSSSAKYAGAGGSTIYGAGGIGKYGQYLNGNDGGYGAGGGGLVAATGNYNYNEGAGGKGLCIVTEFY